MSDKSLTPEEQEYFDSGGVSSLPDDYAKDVPPPPPENGKDGNNAPPPAEDGKQPGTDNGQPAKEGEAGQQRKQGDGDDGRGPVPYRAMKEERERRQEAEQRARLMEQRFNAYLELENRRAQAQQPAQQQTREPSYEERRAAMMEKGDFVGVVDLDYQENQRWRQRDQQRDAEMRQQAEYQRLENAVLSSASMDFEQAKQEDPEFKQADDYIFGLLVQEAIQLQGVPPHLALQHVRQASVPFFKQAMDRGERPSDAMRRLAVMRGFRSQQAQQQDQNQHQRPADADRLAAVKAGQTANTSIGTAGTGASARGGRLDANGLLAMSNKEFEAFLAKDKDKEAWNRAMGG